MVKGRSVQVEDSRGGEYRASFSMEAYLKEPHRRILSHFIYSSGPGCSKAG